jgi:PAS domain S-box-containing protein
MIRDETRSRQIITTVLAFRDGNFSVRLPSDWDGVDGQIAAALNQALSYQDRLLHEVKRLSQAVGREGRLRERMSVPGAMGGWATEVSCFNSLLEDLVRPTVEMSRTIGAVAKGDLGQTMELEVGGHSLKGEFLRSAKLLNTMIEQLALFTSEVTRVAREVGTEGKLGGQAQIEGVSGVWKELTKSVNQMAGNLTAQVRNIADVTIAVVGGDLSKKITVDVRGEILQLKDAINTMVDQLRSFGSEVTRVAREVGTEGRLGGQAIVPGAAGTWKDLTDSVNAMASNLTAQVRNIAQVTTAVAHGDLSRKITVDAKGEILELKETINTMVDRLNGFSYEVTRVAREVGTYGKLGGQAVVPGIAGIWKDLTDSVNLMASNLTDQVHNIAEVTTAVAKGDLSRKITVAVEGEMLSLKNIVNTMVDQLNGFASEVTRVAREVGIEGKLGGQAVVPGVGGTWKDLTDNVNFMASNLTGQVRNIAEVTTAVANGDLSKKIAVEARGEILELKNTINTMVDQLNSFSGEVTRVAREVGTEGRLGGQAVVPGVAGTWKDLTDSVNTMGSNLTAQVRNIAEVTTAVAHGDLNRKITADVRGEILELKNTINTMVEQLNTFAGEVSRVAREVGTEGKLGGQAVVRGAAGTWKDLTDNVNYMASNLTDQVRGIVRVVTAVANGNLNQRFTMQAKGEVAALADTINNMTDTLATFADQVTDVAREVGVEGRLGAQANVPGAAGTWKDLTGNVNLLAANLTNQVRAIADVAIAVTQGDLTRSIQVETRGEVAELKNNINTMISNLRDTTERNREQDWLKTNLARFAGMLQGQRELGTVAQMLLSELSPLVRAYQGTIYHLAANEEASELRLLSTYARTRSTPEIVRLGEGLVGQCAIEKKRILLSDVPPEFIAVSSSLGEAPIVSIVVLPILFEGKTKAVIELATMHRFTEVNLAFLDQLAVSIGVVFNTIEATMRTEGLLEESQRLTVELRELNNTLEQRVAERTASLNSSTLRLRDSERQLQELIAAIPAAIYTTDAEGRITYFNQAAVELSGRTPTIGSDEWCVSWQLYQPDGTSLPYRQSPMALALKEGRDIRNAEAVAERPDGTRVPFIPYPTPLRDGVGNIVGAINMLVDVSERKQAETQQRVLLNELNHRVKNNMQMLQTLLQTETRQAGSTEARAALEEASGRVAAMAAAQQVLYATSDAARFNARDFLNTICEAAKQAFPQELHIDCEADSAQLPNDAAMPLALIANELLTNAVKHGISTQNRPIRVRLTQENDKFLFYVEDEGPGFDLRSVQRRSSGLALVQGLARQLRGKFEVTRTPATRCSVWFQQS